MSKISLNHIFSSFLAIPKINTNLDKITTAFDNTLSRDGTSPNNMATTLDMDSHRVINLGAPVDPNDAVRLVDLGAGGAVSFDWTNLTGKPTTFPPSAHTHPSADITDFNTGVSNSVLAGSNITFGSSGGKLVINATGALSADWNTMINKPITFAPSAHTHPESDITSLVSDLAGKAATSHSHSVGDITAFGTGVAGVLAAGANITLTTVSGTTTITAAGSGASGQKPALLSAFGAIDGGGVNTVGNDTAFTASEADPESDIYIPDGTYKTTKAYTALTKHYVGRGRINTVDPLWIPANFSYAATKPTAAGTGLTTSSGWFSGDQRFTDGGEYRVIGPTVREFDLSSIYYQSTLIPHHAWFDILSGNSGAQAFAPFGGAGWGAGITVIPLHAAPDVSWVGKTVGFSQTGMDGTIVESHTVSSVGPGNQIIINAGLTNNYIWNLLSSPPQIPTIMFGKRTWAGHTYVKVKHQGGGDGYGHIVRLTVDYQPKASETHCFMASTGGQYGGDVNFSHSGTYATGWESQYIDNGFDVAAIAQVDSLIRTNDTSLTGGQFWAGTKFQSGGNRPIDAGHVIVGPWRNGFDTVFATMMETSTLSSNTVASAASFSAVSAVGAVVGDPVLIGDTPTYSGTITSIAGAGPYTIGVSPNLPGSPITSGTIVKYTKGGAVVNMALGQRMFFNSTISANGRGSDPNGIYASNYGNTQGDMFMGTNTDGGGDFWVVGFNGNGHGGSTAKIRLYPTVCNVSVPLRSGQSIEAGKELVTDGSAIGVFGYPAVIFGAGSGNYVLFDSAANQFRFYKAGINVFNI
jgi:hypothetical protein